MQQIIFIYIRLVNFLANFLPFFYFRNVIYYLIGLRASRGVAIHSGVRFFGVNKITIGQNSTINFGVFLDNRDKIFIGSNVSIAHCSKIYTAGHDINSSDFRFFKKRVVIGDYVCVFSNALIMPGVELGKGCVVLPGAVVTKSFAPFSIVGGNPAIKLGNRNNNLCYSTKYDIWGAN